MFNKKEYDKEYYQNHKKHKKEYDKRYRQDNREHRLKLYKEYRKTHKKERRQSEIKNKYDLSYKDWLKIWESQGGKCSICGSPFINPSDACIDHNHKTNKVRGLLCRKCNFGIGYFNDNPELTKEATKYLRRYNGQKNI